MELSDYGTLKKELLQEDLLVTPEMYSLLHSLQITDRLPAEEEINTSKFGTL